MDFGGVKRLIAIGVAAVAVAGLSACSSGGDSSSPTTVLEGASESQAQAEADTAVAQMSCQGVASIQYNRGDVLVTAGQDVSVAAGQDVKVVKLEKGSQPEKFNMSDGGTVTVTAEVGSASAEWTVASGGAGVTRKSCVLN